MTCLSWVAMPCVSLGSDSLYVGAGAGTSDYRGDTSSSHFPFLPGQRLEADLDFREFYLGYRVNERFAVEVGHANFEHGEQPYIAIPGVTWAVPISTVEKVDITQNYLGIVVGHEIWRNLSVLGLMGYTRFDVNKVSPHSQNFIPFGEGLYTVEAPADGIYLGIGVRLELTSRILARAQWTTCDAADFRIQSPRASLEFRF